MDGTILIADDDRTIRTVLTQALTRAGCKVHATGSLATLLGWVKEGRGDLVITDVMMPDGNGLETLGQIKSQRPGLPVFVISAQNTAVTAVRAETENADDYLPKPFDLPDLLKRVARGLQAGGGPETAPLTPTADADTPGLIGASPDMQALFRLMGKLVNSPLPVLVSGESGTGKSLVAQHLHDLSDRRNLPLIQPTPEQIEDATALQGLVRQVGQGSLLLDKLGDLSPVAQANLRAAIDSLPQAGPRIISTSLGDLADHVAEGRFREDLFYRLNGVTLVVPPLRDRGDDISRLATHFLASDSPETTLSPDAVALMRAYSWPGNLRQLRNVMARLGATSASGVISATEVEAALATQPLPPNSREDDAETLSSAIARHVQRYFDLHGEMLPPPGLYARILHEMELPLLEIALQETGGNQAKCADLLGINRNTLRKKIRDLDIEVTRRRKMM